MSRRKTNSNEPADWLLFAEADLEALHLLFENTVAFMVCRSKCAEALEKLMKAELTLLGWPLVKTHDLQHLAGALKSRSSANAEWLQAIVEELSEYYLTGRYPGFDFDDEEDWPALERQLEQIEAYHRIVQQTLGIGRKP